MVEVLEKVQAPDRWFVRATAITGEVELGWVPAGTLELVEMVRAEEQGDEVDLGSKQRVKSVLFTDGPSNSQQVRGS